MKMNKYMIIAIVIGYLLLTQDFETLNFRVIVRGIPKTYLCALGGFVAGYFFRSMKGKG